MSKRNRNFIRGAAMLGIAGIIVKIVGAVFRIPLGNLIGDVGMSYYQTAYPIYNWLLVVSTAGIPTAIAKMISEKEALGDRLGVQRIFKTAFWLLTIIGLGTMVMLMLTSRLICDVVKNPDAFYSMVSIAPALFFVSLMSVYRGYFQGLQEMKAYAVSQVVEQVFRVGLGLGLAFYFYRISVPYAAAGATFGATIGGMAGTLFMIRCYRRFRKNQEPITENPEFQQESSSEIIRRLVKIAVPVTIGASVLPIMNLIDLGIVMNRLTEIGMGDVAKGLYGQLTGYAATVVNLPMIVTAAVQISLVPAVSQYAVLNAKEELDRMIETGIRMGLIISLPSTLGLVVLAKHIMLLLYPMQKAAAISAGGILQVLGWGVFGLSMFQVLTGILQGLGKPWIPARNLAVAAAIKLILSYVLVGIPSINIMGAAGSTAAAFGLAALLNFISLRRISSQRMDLKQVLLKPLGASAVMVLAAWGTYELLVGPVGNSISTLTAVAFSGAVYLVTLIGIGGLTEEDYDLLPGGGKLRKLARMIPGKGR